MPATPWNCLAIVGILAAQRNSPTEPSEDGMGTEGGPGDLQEVQSSDEGTEGSHFPQEAEVEVPQVQPAQDAGACGLKAAKTLAVMVRRRSLNRAAALPAGPRRVGCTCTNSTGLGNRPEEMTLRPGGSAGAFSTFN